MLFCSCFKTANLLDRFKFGTRKPTIRPNSTEAQSPSVSNENGMVNKENDVNDDTDPIEVELTSKEEDKHKETLVGEDKHKETLVEVKKRNGEVHETQDDIDVESLGCSPMGGVLQGWKQKLKQRSIKDNGSGFFGR